MKNINERDDHLKKKIGILPDTEIINTSASSPIEQNRTATQIVMDNTDQDKELVEGRQRLKNINSQLEEVLSSHSDVASDFNKSRDVEAVAQLAKTMIELNKEIRETNKDLYGEKNADKNNSGIDKQQNNIYISGDTRDILDKVSEKIDGKN